MSTILIADDEPGILDVLTCWHSEQDYQITRATSGDDAVRLIPIIKPDLVITDIKMSPGDGFQVLFAAKKQDPYTAVILMTGHMADAAIHVEALKLGADDYICKPFKLEDLDRRVDYALRYRQTQLAKKKPVSAQHPPNQAPKVVAATLAVSLIPHPS